MTEGSNLQIPRLGGGFQAKTQEWDYVILSTVRSTPGALGALEDEHLLDVALTRARHGAGGPVWVAWFWVRKRLHIE